MGVIWIVFGVAIAGALAKGTCGRATAARNHNHIWDLSATSGSRNTAFIDVGRGGDEAQLRNAAPQQFGRAAPSIGLRSSE
jgi:hypothetical protein